MYSPIEKCCVHFSKLLIDGIRAIEAGGAGIALALDDQNQLVGTLTDGNVRRALLRGASLESPLAPYVNRNFTAVEVETDRVEVLDLMQSRMLNQVPIISKDGKLVGLHLLHEIIGAVERPNWAVIMAGGMGMRLRPITDQLPKSMIRVAGRPILERLVLHLVGYGIKRVFLAVCYLGEMIQEHFGDGERFGCRVEYLREKEPLGTGGALSLLPEKPSYPLVMLNGDLLTRVNLEDMLGFHAEGKYIATMGVRRYSHQVPFGCVEIEGNRICRLEEKPVLERMINAGVYVLAPEIIERVPNKFYPITNLFEKCLEQDEPVGVFEIQEEWMDIGQRRQLKAAQEGSP